MRVVLPLIVIVILALVVVQLGAVLLERQAVRSSTVPDNFSPPELPQFKSGPGGKSAPKPHPASPQTPDTFRG